jgi:hypothetical protein
LGGDVFAVLTTGAYGYSLSSNYNAARAEVLLMAMHSLYARGKGRRPPPLSPHQTLSTWRGKHETINLYQSNIILLFLCLRAFHNKLLLIISSDTQIINPPTFAETDKSIEQSVLLC